MKAISSLRQAVRDQLYARPGIWGLTIAALVIIAVIRIIYWATASTVPSTAVLGIVERIYVASESEQGAHYSANVRLKSGAHVNVQFGSTIPCNIGDVIHLTRRQTHFGVVYVADFAACSAKPTPDAPTTSPPARPSLIPS